MKNDFAFHLALVMAEPDGHKDPGYLADVIVEHSVTRVHFVPSMLDVFLAEPKAALCSSLEIVNCSGEALPVHVARKVSEILPNTLVDNLYGPTETTVCATIAPCTAEMDTVPIGRPIANTRIHILDAHQQILPPGIPGELCIAGAGLARGYLNRPELTAEKFITAEILGRTERLYRTGDLARWLPDGNLEYLGRIDHQIKLRGFRIELGEIEAVLSSHEAVSAAAAVLHERAESKSDRKSVV
mgnify:CR=1 FL=1